MRKLICIWRSGFVVAGLLSIAGCNAVPLLSESLSVAISTAARLDAPKGSGPAALANGVWSLSRKADSSDTANADGVSAPPGPYGGLLNGDALPRPPVGERIFLARFGPAGEMVRVTENRFFLPEIYGMEIPIGGEWTSATVPGVFFRSNSFGVQQSGRVGIAVHVQVRLGEVFLGRAVIYAWGTVSGGSLDGTFGYLLDFTEGAVSFLGTVADQYSVNGQRVGD